MTDLKYGDVGRLAEPLGSTGPATEITFMLLSRWPDPWSDMAQVVILRGKTIYIDKEVSTGDVGPVMLDDKIEWLTDV